MVETKMPRNQATGQTANIHPPESDLRSDIRAISSFVFVIQTKMAGRMPEGCPNPRRLGGRKCLNGRFGAATLWPTKERLFLLFTVVRARSSV
jgi:hypothetical protein